MIDCVKCYYCHACVYTSIVLDFNESVLCDACYPVSSISDKLISVVHV